MLVSYTLPYCIRVWGDFHEYLGMLQDSGQGKENARPSKEIKYM